MGITCSVKSFFKKLKYYAGITKMDRIARRFFVMNAFDGILTILGLIVGSFLVGVRDTYLIIGIGISTTIAISISGLSGTFLTEAAERKKELKELEKLLLHKLDKTDIRAASRFATVATAIVDGMSPLIAALFILLPFFLIPTYMPSGALSYSSIEIAYFSSFFLCFVSFFFLGAYLGKISKESMTIGGLKMIAAGVIAAGIAMLLRGAY